MIQLRRFVVALATTGFVFLGGCAVTNPGEEDEVVANEGADDEVNVDVDTDVDINSTAGRTRNQCSADPIGQQRRATKLAAWVLGGTEIDPEVSSCVKHECILSIRNSLAAGTAKVNHSVVLDVECGKRRIPGLHYDLTIADADLTGCASAIKPLCDVGPFFAYTSPKGITMDPEPARTRSSLGSSTGATADAVLVNNGTSTKVLKWSSTYAAGASSFPAGTPCSTTALGENVVTSKTLQASGTLRRCI